MKCLNNVEIKSNVEMWRYENVEMLSPQNAAVI